ncbi:MAG: DNA polymerase/3'-5' exonuclease PolX [Planctomycetota bacterium]|nr:MAG: DNA polymerase/3'-5' exonuclease PolX [Planctomycetota bacterium]
MTNTDIAAVFEELADLLEFRGENPFRVRAYRNAARTISELPEEVEAIAGDSERALTDLPGIGKDLAEKIRTLLETGTLPQLEELKAEIPESVLAMLRVPGLGPKRAAVLFRELNITSLDELAEACRQQKIRKLKGFGAKTEESILKGIAIAASADERTLWYFADKYVQEIRTHLEASPAVKKLEAAGSYRRCRETVGDLDFLIDSDDPAAVMDRFAEYERIDEVLLRGDTKMSVRLVDGIQVDLRVVPAESFGAALQYFTGSKEHNVILRGMAKDRGLKVNEYGVFRGEEYVAGADEADVYAALDLPWIPPELREGRREFEWAAEGKLPELIELDDIRGDLHMHTNWSDGADSIETMVEGAKAHGYEYVAITDHSKRVTIAGGLDAERLLKQWEEIDRINAKQKGIRVLKGVEVDILEDGPLDLPDDVLGQADWVVASVHFGQSQSRDRITKRVVDALAHPAVCAIAHPTGRLLLERDPYAIDMEAVFSAAAEHKKLLELNAHPRRLDLNDVHLAAAKQYGIPIVISTDAHNINRLDHMICGIRQARRGGLGKNDVANTRPWREFKKLLPKYRR